LLWNGGSGRLNLSELLDSIMGQSPRGSSCDLGIHLGFLFHYKSITPKAVTTAFTSIKITSFARHLQTIIQNADRLESLRDGEN
jgi:hypothetical protein